MGNLCTCLSYEDIHNKKQNPKRQYNRSTSAPATTTSNSNRWSRIRSSRRENFKFDDPVLHQQALAAAAIILEQQRQEQRNGETGLPFDRSTSLRYPSSSKHNNSNNKNGGITLPRSSSTRARSLTDPLLQPHQLLNQVILVGHDFGGACISYAMELFPSKVSKAVFIAATMLNNGQSALDIFSQQEEAKDLMKQAQIFLYANGNNNPPTAIDLHKSLLKELLFNQSPSKDVALASVSMRPIPFSPVLEKLCLTDKNYGSVRRFYVETTEDNAIAIASQEQMTKAAPPEQVLRLKGADHSPFFSKPQALHRLLVEVSKVP